MAARNANGDRYAKFKGIGPLRAHFCYALRSLGHINYMCNLRLQYCTQSEKGNLLKLVAEVFIFIFSKNVLKKKSFSDRPTNPNFFSRVT